MFQFMWGFSDINKLRCLYKYRKDHCHTYRGSDGRIARRYTDQDITISLDDRPDREDSRLTVNDIGTFTIWCQ